MSETDGASFAESVRLDAAVWDQAGTLPREVIQAMAEAGFLAADVPIRYGGTARSPSALGQLCAQLGGVCTALRSLVTVQGMVAAAVLRWGTEEQRVHWLPALASGDHLAGFAATEPGAGTDLGAVASSVRRDGRELVLHGHKQWITFGELADVFLVLARLDGQPVTVLVETNRPGTVVEPVRGQLGLRAAQLAHVRFDGVRVPQENLVAPVGFGLSHVAGTALDHGRFTVAWGCVGMATACLEYATAHAANRTQGGVRLADHQVVRAQLGRALVATIAARELCARATRSRQNRTPDALADTMVAKYAAARAAATVSQDAVQVHGAAGCGADSPVGRFFRDAKIMQIIEGAEQVAELHIGDHALRRFGRERQAGAESGSAMASRAMVGAAAPPTVKCLVWDLDDTLWDGVVLEGDRPRPFAAAVETLKTLDQRGILHAVASRGDHETAAGHLADHGLDELFCVLDIEWGSKSGAVRRIAKTLNIGLNTVAFVDNDPVERSEVATTHPEVRCYRADQLTELATLPEFCSEFVTDESRQRRHLYQIEHRRALAEREYDGAAEFLASLQLTMTVRHANEEDLARAHELTVRTHQLNTTGQTFSMAELHAMTRSSEHEVLVASLRDRFGSYGTIGLAVSELAGTDSVLLLLLMSCRVLSRGVGAVLLDLIVHRAVSQGLRPVSRFVSTPVNQIMLVTLRFAGFELLEQIGDHILLAADPDRLPTDRPNHVRIITDEEARQ